MANGEGCECAAYNEGECGCGVDWTDGEIYVLRDAHKACCEAMSLAVRAINREDYDTAKLVLMEYLTDV